MKQQSITSIIQAITTPALLFICWTSPAIERQNRRNDIVYYYYYLIKLLIQIITMIHVQNLPPGTLPINRFSNIPSYRTFEPGQNALAVQGEFRKKIQNYSFLLTDKIGKGYSSTVYKGLDDLTCQEVAIKVIELKSLRDQTSKNMLQTQIQCFRSVFHKNVLKYVNSFYTSNNCYIITQYCPGSDLSRLMKLKGKIPELEAAQYFLQIFQGYKAFNEAGYVHRDLKPANVFVGKDDQLKLADFGFSKKRTLIDRQNYNVGTPIYMPRQSLAANIYNQKTDTWALGITLYEMVYGEVPFRGRSEQQLRVNIEKGVVRFPQAIPVSEEFKDFVLQSLHNDSLQRIGVKQMEKHPWMLKFTSKEKAQPSVQSPQKVQEENIIRTSLPHDGVLHNKSRQYFENKENRRSVSTMQKLKLCMPRKGSQHIKQRQPLVDRTLNLPLKLSQISENKQNKIHNQSIATERQTMKTTNPKKQNPSKGIEKVVSLINYFRLLHRILQKVKNLFQQIINTSMKETLQKIQKALVDRISQIIKKHMMSISDKSNQFNLSSSQWIHFATSERWQMYQFVINRYKNKYAHVLQQSSKCSGEWESASKLFLQLGQYTQNGQVDLLLLRQRYIFIQVLGLLSHLCTLDKLIDLQGWQTFSAQYTSGQSILLESHRVDVDNYLLLLAQLSQQYIFLRVQTN